MRFDASFSVGRMRNYTTFSAAATREINIMCICAEKEKEMKSGAAEK